MKRPNGKRHTARRAIALLLLAVVCVGAVELIACRIYDPPLFDRITAPVRDAWHTAADFTVRCARAAGDAVQRAWTGAGEAAVSLWERLHPKPEWALPPDGPLVPGEAPPEAEADPLAQLPELQLAGDPEILTTAPLADPAVTELRTENGRQVLTGNGLHTVYFNQGEEPWADQLYGSDRIAGYGCGPTAMAMVVATMTDYPADPAQMSQWAYEQGYWARRSGSSHAIVADTAEAYGLCADPISDYTPEAIRDAILSGKLLVALMGPGHFTRNGHFIVLRGITLTGSVLVADPNSVERSLTEWDAQLLLDELSWSHQFGGPLWVISYPETPPDAPLE